MTPFVVVSGKAVPWLRRNVDTDVITPMRRLLLNMDQIEKYAFEPLRYIGSDADTGQPDPSFPLNQRKYAGAKILIAGANFGCGSSRETAPEAIRRCGIRCIISSSFGGIFTKNCYQQGVLPITFPEETVLILAAAAEAQKPFTVNLPDQTVSAADSGTYGFTIGAGYKKLLIEGLEEADVTLREKDAIVGFFEKDKALRPWLY